MSIDVKKLTAKLLRSECGNGAYERGNDYFRRGMVSSIEDRVRDKQVHLSSTTLGSSAQQYSQQIIISDTALGLDIDGECSCPVGFNCKHVVAACLSYASQQRMAQGTSGSADAFSRWLSHHSGVYAEQSGAAEFLLYSLKTLLPNREIAVNFTVARRKRNGSLNKGRSTTFSSLSNHFTPPRYMQPVDEDIISLLKAANEYSWGRITLQGAAGNPALMMMLESGRTFWGDDREQPLRQGPALEAALAWQEDGTALRLRLEMPEEVVIVPVIPPLYIHASQHRVGNLSMPAGIDTQLLTSLADAPAVPRAEAQRLSRVLALNYPQLPTPEPVKIEELVNSPPTPRLNIRQEGGDLLDLDLTLDFIYGDTVIDSATQDAVVTLERQGELLRIHRELAFENAAAEQLIAEGLVQLPSLPQLFRLPQSDNPRQLRLAQWFRFVEESLPRLEAAGWRVEHYSTTPLGLSRADSIEADVESTNNDWFELRFDIEIEGRKIPLLPLVSELLGDYRPGELPPSLYLPYEEGRYVEIAREKIEPVLQNIIELFETLGQSDELRLSRLDAPRLLELGDIQINGGAELKRMARRLTNFSGIKTAKLPTTFKGELRDYQQQGVNWLQFLREYELAGLLADDMGLGKTVQTLAHLAIEKRGGRMQHPSLIIAPTSLMGNWRREAAQFTPGLKVLVLHGPHRSKYFDALEQYDLILTTYPLLPRDGEVLNAIDYHYLILDEAQVIKNHRSRAAQLVRTIRARHRLSLTGTPMENHLGELWAQFDFLLPGFLGAEKQFSRNYRNPIERHGDSEKLQRLSRRTAPFMLRRSKEMVASELPPKSELLRTTPIEGRQATLYESIRLTMEKKVREAISKQGLARSHITILDALLKLRQVCCDPRLLPGHNESTAAPSAKYEMLMEMLPELIDEGRNILLFSQFTKMLGLIEKGLQERGIAYTKLTGQTRKRDEAIETFRRGDVQLFLISLKAGGVGLNLVEADTVIHYDPWWNPAVEAQATDRAHRIGQDKPVFVYKLLTEGTVEEKILAMQEKKRRLAESVYNKDRKEGELLLDSDTINELFSCD